MIFVGVLTMKNNKRLAFLSAIMGLCISVSSLFGTVAFAEETSGSEPVYAATTENTDLLYFPNPVDYFTKDGKEVTKDDIKEITTDQPDETWDYDKTNNEITFYADLVYKVTATFKDDKTATAEVKIKPETEEFKKVKYVDDQSIKATIETKLQNEANLKAQDEKDKNITIPKEFWDIVDLSYFSTRHIATKVYLAKPKTDFSVINSSWKAEMSKITLSASGTYAFYVEIKDYLNNELVVDKDTMELREDGWYNVDDNGTPDDETDDIATLVIPVFTFEYNPEVVVTAKIEARATTGIIGVEYNSGKVTTENVARPTIKLYYNANPDATLSGFDALTSANGWNVATAEQATHDAFSTTSLKFTPLVKGAFAFSIVAIGSDVDNTTINAVSGVIRVTQTVQEQKLVNVKFRNFVKTNWLSLVFLGIAFLCVIGIIVLAFYKPKDADEIAAKKAKEEVEDEEAEEAVEEVEEVEETEEATEEVEETAEETPVEEVEEAVEETPAEEVEETPVEEETKTEENA